MSLNKPIHPLYTSGEWYQYFYSKEPKNFDQMKILREYFKYFELHIPFLDKTQHWGRVYQSLGIPHVCGKIHKQKLKELYTQEKKLKPRMNTLQVFRKTTHKENENYKDIGEVRYHPETDQTQPSADKYNTKEDELDNVKAIIDDFETMTKITASSDMLKKQVRFNNVQILHYDKSISSESEFGSFTQMLPEGMTRTKSVHQPYFERLNDSVGSQTDSDGNDNDTGILSPMRYSGEEPHENQLDRIIEELDKITGDEEHFDIGREQMPGTNEVTRNSTDSYDGAEEGKSSAKYEEDEGIIGSSESIHHTPQKEIIVVKKKIDYSSTVSNRRNHLRDITNIFQDSDRNPNISSEMNCSTSPMSITPDNCNDSSDGLCGHLADLDITRSNVEPKNSKQYDEDEDEDLGVARGEIENQEPLADQSDFSLSSSPESSAKNGDVSIHFIPKEPFLYPKIEHIDDYILSSISDDSGDNSLGMSTIQHEFGLGRVPSVENNSFNRNDESADINEADIVVSQCSQDDGSPKIIPNSEPNSPGCVNEMPIRFRTQPLRLMGNDSLKTLKLADGHDSETMFPQVIENTTPSKPIQNQSMQTDKSSEQSIDILPSSYNDNKENLPILTLSNCLVNLGLKENHLDGNITDLSQASMELEDWRMEEEHDYYLSSSPSLVEDSSSREIVDDSMVKPITGEGLLSPLELNLNATSLGVDAYYKEVKPNRSPQQYPSIGEVNRAPVIAGIITNKQISLPIKPTTSLTMDLIKKENSNNCTNLNYLPSNCHRNKLNYTGAELDVNSTILKRKTSITYHEVSGMNYKAREASSSNGSGSDIVLNRKKRKLTGLVRMRNMHRVVKHAPSASSDDEEIIRRIHSDLEQVAATCVTSKKSTATNMIIVKRDEDNVGRVKHEQPDPPKLKSRKTSIVKQQINRSVSDTSTSSQFVSSALARRIYYLN